MYAPANPSPSDHPGEVPEPLTVAQSGAVLCSGHVIAGQLCSAHLFAPLEQHQDTRPSKHLHVVQTGQDGDALVVPGGEEMASVGDLTTCQEQGGVSEAGVASALAVKLCEALQVSGLAWDDVAVSCNDHGCARPGAERLGFYAPQWCSRASCWYVLAMGAHGEKPCSLRGYEGNACLGVFPCIGCTRPLSLLY